jgi:hypothetical protein
MLPSLVTRGAVFPLVYFLRHVFPKNEFLKNQQTVCANTPRKFSPNDIIHRVEIDRKTDLSEKDFIQNYLNKCRPVVFNAQAANWDCCKKWNLDFIENELKDVSFLAFENIKPHSGELPDYETQYKMQITSSELTHAIQNEQAYLRFSTMMDEQRHLVEDLDKTWLKKMRRGFFGVCYQNFIGAKGRKTTLHSGSTPFFYIMAYGEKKWTLTATSNSAALNPSISHHSYFHTDVDLEDVDEKRNPGLVGETVYYAHLKQGDILFVPSWMWHQVENMTHSWGLSYNFSALRSFLRYPLFVAVRFFFRKPAFISTLFSTMHVTAKSKTDDNMPEFFYD